MFIIIMIIIIIIYMTVSAYLSLIRFWWLSCAENIALFFPAVFTHIARLLLKYLVITAVVCYRRFLQFVHLA